MKPFITDGCKDGRYTFRLQLEGVKRERLADTLIGNCIVAYALPEKHSFESAWQFRIFMGNDEIFEFSSACTAVAGWQEVGSLTIGCMEGERDSGDSVFKKYPAPRFCIAAVDCLVYEEANVYSECGIVLHDSGGGEWIIAAGVSPGSVSVKTPFSEDRFLPEFSANDYSRVAL